MMAQSTSLSSPVKIENLLNPRHPMIAPLIGCVLVMDSTVQREFKTRRLYAADGSLANILSNRPAWWTPTAKVIAKAVVEIALVFGLHIALDCCMGR
jgi:hypothetical protein